MKETRAFLAHNRLVNPFFIIFTKMTNLSQSVLKLNCDGAVIKKVLRINKNGM
jgi:hypothetical protein